MPYRNARHAMQLARAGGGSLAGTLVTADSAIARQFIAGAARAHGRIQILNEESSKSLPATAPRCLSWCTAARAARAAAKSWAACAR
jgi:acyl-CoA reductase-like NAD-dependent aldehyde dehydrogenase